MNRLIAAGLALALTTATACAEESTPEEDDFRTASAPGAVVYIISPADGETVKSPFTVKFGLKGMGVAPAGIEKAHTGHHHILINRDLPPLDEAMPTEEGLTHFGGGQTETELDLPPGTHTLQLILGDQNHIPHNPPLVSEKITITVTE